ncbi:MAG: TetR/AcrR family transcriptional regulator [Bdellovibrionales bacterium]
MSGSTKREDGSQETKSKIFEAAAKVFALKGYQGGSMREIARAADVNLALINYHFKDKKQLFISVFDHGLGVWAELLESKRGAELSELLAFLMKETTDIDGAAYYMNIFMRLFLGRDVEVPQLERIFTEGPPSIDVLQEAVAKRMKRDSIIDPDVILVTNYLMNYLVLSSRYSFGMTKEISDKSYIRPFLEGEDLYTSAIIDLADRLCRCI